MSVCLVYKGEKELEAMFVEQQQLDAYDYRVWAPDFRL